MADLQALFGIIDQLDTGELEQVRQYVEQRRKAADDLAIRAALAELVRWPNPDEDTDKDIENEAPAIDRAFRGTTPLSEVILQDRGEG